MEPNKAFSGWIADSTSDDEFLLDEQLSEFVSANVVAVPTRITAQFQLIPVFEHICNLSG